MKPLISIIVPVYNSEKYLAQCLSSLRDQTYTNIEVLLIDDGSSDNSASICRSFAKADKRFHYYYQENSGVSAARNKGIDLAIGEYIGFCDSDDWVEKDMYETLVSLLEKEDADASIIHFYTNDNVEMFSDQNFCVKVYSGREAVLQIHLNRLSAPSLWNKLFRRTLFEGVRLHEEITNREDMLAVWELFIKAKRVVYSNEPKYHYYVRGNSLSSVIKESYWSYRRAAQIMKEKMQQVMPECIGYAQRSIIMFACWDIDKLARMNRLQTNYYEMLRNDIVEQYDDNVKKLFSVTERIVITMFSSNKYIATIFAHAMNVKRKLRHM